MSLLYLLDPAGVVLGRLDQSYESMTTTLKYQGGGSISLTINRQTLYAEQIVAGTFLYLPDGQEVYEVEQVESVAEGSAANEQMTVSGRSIDGFILQERRAIPPPGEAYDAFSGPAESAIKHFVDGHAGPGAAAARQVPNLVIAPDAASGAVVDIAARYKLLEDVLAEIGAVSGMGWATTYDPVNHEFVFDTVMGADLSDEVFFDFDFQTLERWVEVISLIDSKTFAIVAGQGEAEDREIVYRWSGTEPSGFDRRETFIDARDVEQGQTALLEQRGDAAIASVGGERRLEATAHQYGSFRYREHWDLGDIVLVRNVRRGLAFPARVVQVSRSWTDSAVAPTLTAALDRALPTIKEKVAQVPTSTIDYAVGGAAAAIILIVDSLGRLVLDAADAWLVN